MDGDKCQINNLSDCVLERIFTSINPYDDFANIRLVCRRWNRVGTMALIRMKRQFYRCNNFSWRFVDEDLAHSNLLSERCSHSACYHPKEKVMFMFGGCTSTYTAFNDLWLFDLSTREWQRIIISRPPLPSAKALASLVLYHNNLILYGGFSKSSMNPIHQTTTFYKEIHLFNRSKNCWEEIICENTAPHLAGHTATIVGDFMLVFGGSMGSSYNNNVYVLDITRRIWNMPSIPGPCPPPRYGQSQILLDQTHLVIIGGCGGPSVMFNDVWLLDFDLNGETEWKWTQLKVENIDLTPPYMWCHRACKVDTNAVVLSRPTKYDISKRSRRRRASTQSNTSGSGSTTHLPYRISTPDSPQDRRAVAAAFCSAQNSTNSAAGGLVTSSGNAIGSIGSGWGCGGLAAKRKPILLSSRSLDEQDQKTPVSNASSATQTGQPQHYSKTPTSSTNGQSLKPQTGYRTSSELHRACSIPAIIVGEIPKLIVTASNDSNKAPSAAPGAALIVVDEPQAFSTSSNINNTSQSFKANNNEDPFKCDKSKVKFGIDSQESDSSKDSNTNSSMHGDAVRDYYMSLLKEEYNRQKIVELDENLGKIDQKLNIFLGERVPYLTAQERSEMIDELLKRGANETFDSEDDNESIPSTSSSRNRRQNIGKLSNNSGKSQRTSLDSSTSTSSRRPSVQSATNNGGGTASVGDSPNNGIVESQFGQIYYRHMCVYVLRLADAIHKRVVRWEQLAVEEDAPEDIILYSIVAGQGELILFGGMRSDDGNGMDCLNVGMDRHAMSSDTYIIRPRYSDFS